MAQAIAILGAGLGGTSAGMEQNRLRMRQEEDDAFRREQRARTRLSWEREDKAYNEAAAEKLAVRNAMAPVEVTQEQLQGPTMPDEAPLPMTNKVGGQAFASPAEAQAAADKANAMPARMQRVAGVMRDPVKAAEMAAGANRAELDAMNLTEARQNALRQQFRRDLVKSYAQGGFAGGLQFMNDSHGDGRGGKLKFSATPTADGRLQVSMTGDDGKPLGAVGVFENSVRGFGELSTLVDLQTSPQQLLAHFQHLDKIKADADQRKTDNELKARHQKEIERHNQAIEGVYMARVTGAGAGRAAGEDSLPALGDKSETFLRERYTVKDPMSGSVGVDGVGMQFGKLIALAQAQRNGGDETRALGFAFEKDNELRTAAEQEVEKATKAGQKLTLTQAHNQLRIGYLQHIGAIPKPPPPPTKDETESFVRKSMQAEGDQAAEYNIGGHNGRIGTVPAKREEPGRMSAAAAAAFKPDPKLEPKLRAELLEMANGKRMRFSTPELAAYNRTKAEAERRAPYQPSQALQDELARAQRVSREQLGVR